MPPFERRDPLTSQYHPIAYAFSRGRGRWKREKGERRGERRREREKNRDGKRERESGKEKNREGGKMKEIERGTERKK